MAWELDAGMHAEVRKAVYAKAHGMHNGQEWAIDVYARQRGTDQATEERARDHAADLVYNLRCVDVILDEIAYHAVNVVSATTNGGHAVYLDDAWSVSVPWADEDDPSNPYA